MYSLTWTCKFPNDEDTYYFAHCYPYTYSDLQDYLNEIQVDHEKSQYCKQKVLCRSLAGNYIYMLTITNPTTASVQQTKKGVVVTARVHPGETNASWMMKGLLDFLLGDSADAKVRRRIEFSMIYFLEIHSSFEIILSLKSFLCLIPMV